MAELTKATQMSTENRPDITDIEGVGIEVQESKASLSQTDAENPVVTPASITPVSASTDQLQRNFETPTGRTALDEAGDSRHETAQGVISSIGDPTQASSTSDMIFNFPKPELAEEKAA